MKSIVEEFDRRTVEMHQPKGITNVTGWCYGEIAVLPTMLDERQVWCLNCIPRGVTFPTKVLGLYRSIEDACGAAKAMAKLNNCWALTDSFSDEQLKAMKGIALEFNGYTHCSPEGMDHYPPAESRPFLNGASREQYLN